MKISWRRIQAIFIKECKDARKCPPVIIAFFMIPILACIMKLLLPDANSEMILSMFYPMHIVMSGLLSCSVIMAEEKEKNTLRVLIMNMVKPFEYIVGIGMFVFIGQMVGSVFFILITKLSGDIILQFFGVTILGCLCSILLGAFVGVIVKNQISVAPHAVPIMLVLTFIPIFSSANESIAGIGKYLYSQQVSNIIVGLTQGKTVPLDGIIIMFVNLILFAIIFTFAYHHNKLEA